MHSKIFLVISFVLTIGSPSNTQEFEPFLQEYYLKDYQMINCQNQTKIENFIDLCLSKTFDKINIFKCKINEIILRNEANNNLKCSNNTLNYEKQPYFKKDEQEQFENSTKFVMLVHNVGHPDLYYFGYILSNYTIKLFAPKKKDICYEQKVKLNALYVIYNTKLKWIMIPTMLTSIMFATLIIVVYLSLRKLRTLYFGKCVICHCLAFVISQLLYIKNYKYFTADIITNAQELCLIFQASFRMCSYCWINVLSYNTFITLTR